MRIYAGLEVGVGAAVLAADDGQFVRAMDGVVGDVGFKGAHKQ